MKHEKSLKGKKQPEAKKDLRESTGTQPEARPENRQTEGRT